MTSKNTPSIVPTPWFFSGLLMLVMLLQGCDGDTTGFKEAVFVADKNIESIAIKSVNTVISLGEAQPYQALGSVVGGTTTEDISASVHWVSSDEAVARISSAGVVTGVSDGSVTISATIGNITGSTILMVSSAELSGISITSIDAVTPVCTSSTQLTATGLYTDSTERSLTASVTWGTADAAIATVNSAGTLYAFTPGNAVVFASKGGITSNQLNVSITDTLSSITLTPADLTLAETKSQQYSATGLYSDGLEVEVSKTAEWGVTDATGAATDVATLSNASGSKGLLKAVKVGSAVVNASCNNILASTGVTVTGNPVVSTLSINDDARIIELKFAGTELTEQLRAKATLSDGTADVVTEKVTWFVSAIVSGTSATVSNATGSKGQVKVTAIGETIIKANYGNELAEITIKVTE